MRTIHKYVLADLARPQTFKAPASFEPHFFERQGTDYCVWAEVDTSTPICNFEIQVFGTGHHIPADFYYVGSVVADPFVWHAFWRKS